MPGFSGVSTPQPGRLHVEIRRKYRIGFVHINGRARQVPQLLRAAYVIDMSVRDHDHRHFEQMAVENFNDLRNVVARIDNDRLQSDLIADDRASCRPADPPAGFRESSGVNPGCVGGNPQPSAHCIQLSRSLIIGT